MFGLAHESSNCGADLDALAIVLGRKDGRVGLAVWRGLAGLVFISIETIDADGIENFEIALPHARERQAIKPGIIRNKANDAVSGLFDDAPLRHTEEAHVKIV